MEQETKLVKYEISPNEIQVLEQSGIIPKDTPKPTVMLFAAVCQRRGLSPESKQIHLVKRYNREKQLYDFTIQTGIDGYRSIAERTALYAGSDDYLYNDGKTPYELKVKGIDKPVSATATVYKLINGIRTAFTATVLWDEYVPGEKMDFMWKRRPFGQLGKCAETLALRKAFPEILGDIRTNEEMSNAELWNDNGSSQPPAPPNPVQQEVRKSLSAPPPTPPPDNGAEERKIQAILAKINNSESEDELRALWSGLSEQEKKESRVNAAKERRKKELHSEPPPATNTDDESIVKELIELIAEAKTKQDCIRQYNEIITGATYGMLREDDKDKIKDYYTALLLSFSKSKK